MIIRVGVVDDHSGVRAGIIGLLKGAKDILVVGEGANGAGALALARNQKPDLMLLDVELPDIRGDVVMGMIHQKQPEIKVLPVSTYSDSEHVRSMVDNGADGYITKDEAPTLLLEAIRAIFRGAKWVSPKATRSMGRAPVVAKDLTERETHILEQLLLDKSYGDIADALDMDEKQIGRYVMFLMAKFDVHSLEELKSLAAARRNHSSPAQNGEEAS